MIGDGTIGLDDLVVFIVNEGNTDAIGNGGTRVRGGTTRPVATSNTMLGLLEVEEEDGTSTMVEGLKITNT